ncbi:hypothetical protein LJK88_26980 [Paenibacillus sp. P26]|nr:hypothetical protein LJK88_26980 [Paenibacillus sp. P26]
MERLRSEFTVKLALAVIPVDVVTGQAPASAARLTLEGIPGRPVRKPDGTFVLEGLPKGEYSIVLTAPYYMDSRAVVDTRVLNPLEPVLIPLPTPSYPFAEGAALLRVRVRASGALTPGDTILRAVVTDMDLARAKLPGDTNPGETRLPIGAANRLVSGRCYYVLDKDPAQREFIRIKAIDETGRRMNLQTPLRFSHSKGTALVDVAEGSGDGRGNGRRPSRRRV